MAIILKRQMSTDFNCRHSHAFRAILFSSIFQFIVGYVLVVILPSWIFWGHTFFNWPSINVQSKTLFVNSAAFVFSFFALNKFSNYPGTKTLLLIIPTIVIAWFVVFFILILVRENEYSRQLIIYSFVMTNIWIFGDYIFKYHFFRLNLALVPLGRALDLVNMSSVHIRPLAEPKLTNFPCDGVVADLHAAELTDEWEYFLAQCILMRIPVFHSQQIIESFTGRVEIDHLSENIFGNLLPSRIYSGVKRLIETVLIVISSPIWLLIIFLAGTLIKIESNGPMLFSQKRVGQGNKDFKVYKLRSMRQDAEKNGAQFAQADDARVTRVGKFIRRTRIDEIPQFINVLKGEMSLIGPRPEQRAFVEKFEKEIPFYAYRHVVKPGITGWAQVLHGYTANTEDTRKKIAHDFYYIKHFSIWLDIIIFYKTLRTILTGFGSR